MEIYWIFIIFGIVVTLNSGKIDEAVQANKKIKKLIIALCCALIFVNAYLPQIIFI